MQLKRTLSALLLAGVLILSACGGGDKKPKEGKEGPEPTVVKDPWGDDGMVPKIDTANLKDEASILAAMRLVVDARVADEKKQKEQSGYPGHYLELTRLYTAVLNASTAYTKTITDPAKAVEFGKKVSEIQEKMNPK